ncbi:hypothetical protein PRIC2_011389 [Phytophthora ramorum]
MMRAYGELNTTCSFRVGHDLGIVSQCMLAKHIPKCNPQYIANILMKVNTKLGVHVSGGEDPRTKRELLALLFRPVSMLPSSSC